MTTITRPASPTARLLERAIAYSGRTQKEIAHAATLPNPNTISMMKTGEMKVPLERILAIAKACGIDAAELLVTAMREYQPEIWGILSMELGDFLTPEERDIIEAYRVANPDGDVHITEPVASLLLQLFLALKSIRRPVSV